MRALALLGACALKSVWASSIEDASYTPMIEKITFSYGVLDPLTFDGAQKFTYDLHVPKCPAGLNYHLLDLSIYIEAGSFSDHISVTAGSQFEEGDHSVNMILNESSGIEEYNFEGLEMVITVWSNAATRSSQQEVEYRIKVLPLLTDALEVDQKCLLCPAPKNYESKKKVTCRIPNATIVGDSCTCNRGYAGRLTLDKTTRRYSGTCKKADQCNIENAKIVNERCVCNQGYQGILTHDPLNMTWTGYCTEKKETPVITQKPYKKQGRWPCEGITPFECFDCPTCDEAGNIMEDLEKSCNIPEDFGLGGETYAEGSGYKPHLHKFDRSYRFPDGRSNRIIYHTRWSHVSKLNPTLRTHVCMSPICRWRIEMAFNSFANCQTLEPPHGNQIVHWRNYTDFTMHTMKHIILIMEAAKADCHEVSTPTNVFTGTEVRQMFRIHGIDISTDATLRQAESVIRQAFSNYLRYPMRLLNVNIEGEPHPECPLAFDSPACAHVDCGYGQCVPQADGDGYDCFCNQCFRQGYHKGVKTCVHKSECKIVDACQPKNPCQCGGICVNCPECQGNRKYSCQCPVNFTGPHCETLSCPRDWTSVAPSEEAKCGMCTPIEKNNDCDPNPCQNEGLCELTGEGGLPGSISMRGGEQATHEDAGRKAGTGFKCNCGAQYTGDRCERLKCGKGMVEHNGACEIQEEGYHPECMDRTREECPSIGPNGKTCVWNDGTGKCEEFKSHCQPNPCLNGGRCFEDSSVASGYHCHCDQFHSGGRCENKIDVCRYQPSGAPYEATSGPCQTDFTCHEDRSLSKGYRCVCPDCEKLEEEESQRPGRGAGGEGTNYRRRRLDYAPRFAQWKWDHSQSLPRTLPLPDPFPTDFDPLVKRSEHCIVYQKSMHMGAEVRLNIKCPVTSGKGECDEIAKKLEEFQTHEATISAMEKRIQWNCIAAKITGVTEPHEEIQVANCPNMREYKFRWHFAYQECQFETLGMKENAEWAVKISDDGVETCDDKYNEVICKNPRCRALLLDIALLFRECPNSSQGPIGQLARRAKAMRNSVKSCVDPKLTNVVLRVQVGVQGVMDPLSNKEILYVQDWLRNDIISRTGAPDDMVVVNAQPVLHVNDWQSRVPPTFNNIYSDEVQPQKGWLPADLHAVEGRNPVATRCSGFCIVTLQPGPSLHPVDPMAGLFVTYSEPIRLGPCLESMQCKVSLVPEHTAKGHYILNNDDFSPRTEIVTSGETLGMYPRLSLKPNTKYNVIMDEGVIINARTGAPSPAVQYWFITSKPRDSLIKIGIAIGCESQLEYDNYASYLPDYAGAPQANLIDPIRDVVRQFREDSSQKEEEEAEKRRMDTVESEDGKPKSKSGSEDQSVDEESVEESFGDEYPMTERRRLSSLLKGIEIVDDDYENLDEDAIWAVMQHRELAESEAGDGTSAVPIPEQRQVIPCNIKPYWWVFALFCIIPLIICFLAVCCVARAIEPWVQDIRRETIGTNMAYTRMTDGGYRSKCVEDKDSISFRLGGVVCYTPTLFVITVLISFLFGIFWGHFFFSDEESTYWIGGLFGALICAMVWATFVAIMATWSNPGQLPFFRDNRTVTRMKWSENQPRSKRGPPCFLDIDYAAQSYASTMVESDSKPEKVTVTVYRDVVQDGARAPSRLTIPIESSQNNAVMAFHLATLVFFAMLFLFTTLAMQMCPDISIIYFILICILSGLINGLLGVFLFWILARKHCWHAAVSVLYRPYREIKMAKLPSIEYDEAKEFLARDIVFEEGSRVVKKIVVTPGASPARAEHVKPGMELVQIKAITPLGLGPPQVEFVGSSGEQGDAVRLLRQFEEKFRFRPNAPGTGPDDERGQSKFVDIVLTFKHPRVQYQTPCN